MNLWWLKLFCKTLVVLRDAVIKALMFIYKLFTNVTRLVILSQVFRQFSLAQAIWSYFNIWRLGLHQLGFPMIILKWFTKVINKIWTTPNETIHPSAPLTNQKSSIRIEISHKQQIKRKYTRKTVFMQPPRMKSRKCKTSIEIYRF